MRGYGSERVNREGPTPASRGAGERHGGSEPHASAGAAGCTGIIAAGLATCDGVTRIGQTHDRWPSSVLGLPGVTRTLEIRNHPSGTRTLGDLRTQPDRFDAWLSSRGVARISNLRAPRPGISGDCSFTFADDQECLFLEVAFEQARNPGIAAPGSEDASRILPVANSAREAVDRLTEGMKTATSGSVVVRPIRHAAVAVSNRFVSRRLRRFEQVAWGAERQKRAQRLLRRRAGKAPLLPFASRGITTPYMFQVLRSHPLGYDLTYEFDDRGNISVLSFGWRTVFAEVSELRSPREIMGTLWATANFPPTSPFVPFFTGLPEIPPSYAPGSGNRTTVFETLFRTVMGDPQAIDWVQAQWERFEFREQMDLQKLRRDMNTGAPRALTRAETHLFSFCVEMCGESIEQAESMVKKLRRGERGAEN